MTYTFTEMPKRILIRLILLPLLAGPVASAEEPFLRLPLHFDHLSVEDGLSQSTVFTIIQDTHDYLWFGTEDGLNKFDGYEFTVYRHRTSDPRSISDNWISAVYEDRHGDLWIATRKGLDRFERTSATFIHFPAPVPGKEAWCIREDSLGRLWIGTDSGLYRMDRTTGKFFHFPINPARPTEIGVRSIIEDPSGDLWLATWGSGLIRFDSRHNSMQVYLGKGDSRYLRALYMERSGRLWVAGDGGLAEVNRKAHQLDTYHIPEAEALRLDVTSIFEDDSGFLWLGTWGNGIYVLSPDRAHGIHLRNNPSNPHGLSHNTVWSINQDRSGVLWLGSGTGGGLNRLVLLCQTTSRVLPAARQGA
jgi:two-component system, sensor histidine kinase ChiS